MKRIGERALTFRLPAVIKGKVTLIDPDQFLGQWVVLSFLPAIEPSEKRLWDLHATDLEELGAALLLVPLETQVLREGPSCQATPQRGTILGDPLGRLQRIYGGEETQSAGRARTFLIDPDGLLRFHLLHSLTEHGMGVLKEVLQACQDAAVAALV